jgi:hypothetical protein
MPSKQTVKDIMMRVWTVTFFLLLASMNAQTVSGIISTNDSKGMADHLVLYIFNANNYEFVSYAFTDSTGRYSVQLNPGLYVFANFDFRYNEETLGQILLTSDQNQLEKNFTLTRAIATDAELRGRVLARSDSSERTPVALTTIVFYSLGRSKAESRILPENEITLSTMQSFRSSQKNDSIPGIFTTVTDYDGYYYSHLQSGLYTMQIAKSPNNSGYISPLINIVSGDVRSWNIMLTQSTSHVPIRGTISANNSDALINVVIAFSLTSTDYYYAITSVGTEYELMVEPGYYVVTMTTLFTTGDAQVVQYFGGGNSISNANIVSVSNEGLTDVDFITPNRDQASNFVIAGRVTDLETGMPIANAEVTAKGKFWQEIDGQAADMQPVLTDADGQYSITGQFIGDERVAIVGVKAQQYEVQFYDDQDFAFTAQRLNLKDGSLYSEIDFSLRPFGTEYYRNYSIEGTVVLPDIEDGDTGYIYAIDIDRSRLTAAAPLSENGQFRLGGFNGGENVVLFAKAENTIPYYYGGSGVHWAEAAVLTVDGHLTDISFTLPGTQDSLFVGSLAGTITLANTKQSSDFAGGSVLIKHASGEQWLSGTLLDDNGSFTLPIGTQGVYHMEISIPGQEKIERRIEVNEETGLMIEGVDIQVINVSTVDDVDNRIAGSFNLHTAFPNPFNPTTTITVEAIRQAQAQLAIYNASGQRVRLLFAGVINAGQSNFVWNGRNDSGQTLPSGAYFCQFRAAGFVDTKKIIFLK